MAANLHQHLLTSVLKMKKENDKWLLQKTFSNPALHERKKKAKTIKTYAHCWMLEMFRFVFQYQSLTSRIQRRTKTKLLFIARMICVSNTLQKKLRHNLKLSKMHDCVFLII